MSTPLYHGGAGGRNVGDRILPPATTDAKCTAPRSDRVYLTTNEEIACGFAVLHPDGAIYEVIAAEPLELDPETLTYQRRHGECFQAPAATVVAIVDVAPIIRRLGAGALTLAQLHAAGKCFGTLPLDLLRESAA